MLYGYYLVSAMGLRAMSPALALMTSQEAHLSGSFRSAHQVCDPAVDKLQLASALPHHAAHSSS